MIALLSASCKKSGCTDPFASNYSEKAEENDGSCSYSSQDMIFKFKFMFQGQEVNSSDLAQLKYTNSKGNVLSITKLQYLLSDFRFIKENGDSLVTDEYHLIDIEDETTLSKTLQLQLRRGKYNAIAFNYGFELEDNNDGEYTDLNVASWSWPAILGGGYHQLKFEGNFINADDENTGYQMHNGSKAQKITGETANYYDNHLYVLLEESAFEVNANTKITVVMNIDQWFENPNLWDLNEKHTMLMPDYDSQIKMRQNGSSVFTLESVK